MVHLLSMRTTSVENTTFWCIEIYFQSSAAFREVSPPQFAFTNCHNVSIVFSGASFHFASVPSSPVETVSETSSSFNLLSNFSSPLIASTKSMSVSISVSIDKSPEVNQSERGAATIGECTGPPGARIEPTALDRETLFGRTKKLFFPGMMRNPYFSPRESNM